jgi:hypothetical protein
MDGDDYCTRIDGVGPYCSKCTSEDFGCMDAVVEAGCRPDNVTTVADDTATSDPSATTPTMDSADDDDSATSSVEATSDPTTDPDSGESESTGEPPPVCNDGMLHPDEVCDGTNLDGYDCGRVGHEGGDLACDPETCEFDFDGCSSDIPVCGDGVVNQMSEICDINDFDEQTCDMQPGHGNKGELACTSECEIDASACCLDADEPCTANEQCCSGICNLLGLGEDKCTL